MNGDLHVDIPCVNNHVLFMENMAKNMAWVKTDFKSGIFLLDQFKGICFTIGVNRNISQHMIESPDGSVLMNVVLVVQ